MQNDENEYVPDDDADDTPDDADDADDSAQTVCYTITDGTVYAAEILNPSAAHLPPVRISYRPMMGTDHAAFQAAVAKTASARQIPRVLARMLSRHVEGSNLIGPDGQPIDVSDWDAWLALEANVLADVSEAVSKGRQSALGADLKN